MHSSLSYPHSPNPAILKVWKFNYPHFPLQIFFRQCLFIQDLYTDLHLLFIRKLIKGGSRQSLISFGDGLQRFPPTFVEGGGNRVEFLDRFDLPGPLDTYSQNARPKKFDLLVCLSVISSSRLLLAVTRLMNV